MSYTRLFLICLSVCGAAISAEAVNKSTKPNILVLIADDAGMDFGCYGNDGIKTPNIDALAASGLRIDKAFLTGSQCSPSRTAMITGQFAHTIGTEKLILESAGLLHRLDAQEPYGGEGRPTISLVRPGIWILRKGRGGVG